MRVRRPDGLLTCEMCEYNIQYASLDKARTVTCFVTLNYIKTTLVLKRVCGHVHFKNNTYADTVEITTLTSCTSLDRPR